jgi:hypothetical protein
VTEHDSERFATLLAGMGEVYNQTVSPLRITIYFKALVEYEFEQINAAVMRHIQTSKFFASPADLREHIDGSDVDREGVAWNAITSAIAVVGPWQSVIVEDPVVAAAICLTFGSWVGACETRRELHEAQWHARRKDFGSAIRSARRDPQIRRGGPRLLTGIADAENRASRSMWADGRKLSYQAFGVIQVNGRVESKRLELDQATLLPKMSLREALLLPPVSMPLLLNGQIGSRTEAPIDPEFLELNPEQARQRFQEKFTAMLQQKGLTDGPRAYPSLQTQGRRENSKPLPVAQAAAAGSSTRRPDAGGQASARTGGVSVRGEPGSQVEVRSGVAGSHAGSGNRGRGVRERGPRGNRRVDEDARQNHPPATGQRRKNRRTA